MLEREVGENLLRKIYMSWSLVQLLHCACHQFLYLSDGSDAQYGFLQIIKIHMMVLNIKLF